jgi:hypothetical protein
MKPRELLAEEFSSEVVPRQSDTANFTGSETIASPVRTRRKHLPEPNPDKSPDFSPPRRLNPEDLGFRPNQTGGVPEVNGGVTANEGKIPRVRIAG